MRGIGFVLSFLFFLLVLFLLLLYWFVPLNTTKFNTFNAPQNYTLDKDSLQFYKNLRFAEPEITYQIGDCSVKKRDDMKRAFNIIENKTSLTFIESYLPQIKVTCEETTKKEGELFIAGEGGPTNITKSGEFNVISAGKILLLRKSSCPDPNIAVHELLHVLGFNHTENPGSIMYPITNCDQKIDSEIIELLNEIYSIPSQPDLELTDVSALMKGKYLNVNLSISNNGLANSQEAQIKIYADEKEIKTFDLTPLEIGHGKIISLTNIWVPKITIDSIKIEIEAPFSELKKENNKALLELKN